MTKEEAINEIKSWDFLEGKEIEAIRTLIPELTESEDERIKKALIEVFKKKLERGYEWVEYGIPNRSVLDWLEKQKERKPLTTEETELNSIAFLEQIGYTCIPPGTKPAEKSINWTELTWKDINELEDIINEVHYEFRNGIGEESFGKEVLEKFREYKGDEYLDEIEQNPAEWSEEDEKRPEEGLLDEEKIITGIIDGITNLASPSNFGDSITFGGFNWKDCVIFLKKLIIDETKRYTFADLQESYKRGHLKGEEVGREKMMVEIQRDHEGEEWINPDDFTAHIRQAYQDGFREGVESIKSTEWSEEDEEMISNIISSLRGYMCLASKSPYYTNHEAHIQKEIEFLNTLPERLNLQPKQEWSEEDERIVHFYEADYNNQIGDMSMKDVIDMRLKFKDWLVNRLKDLRPQPKQEWNEEDEHCIELLDTIIDSSALIPKNRIKCHSFLKSLRPHWKPSEEQIGALNYAYCELFKREDVGHNILGPLQKLLDDLKKLM